VHQGGFSLHDPNNGFVNVMKGECDHMVTDLNKRSHAHFIQRKEPEYLPSIAGKITRKHTQHTHTHTVLQTHEARSQTLTRGSRPKRNIKGMPKQNFTTFRSPPEIRVIHVE
jgi:hypothetical protein